MSELEISFTTPNDPSIDIPQLGQQGLSAYQVAVANGFVGTESEWLASLEGAAGPANTISIGTVTTGDAGTSASATMTGTSPNQTLNLTIPKGDPGDGGAGSVDWPDITNKPSTFAPSAHTHPQSEITNLVTDLAGKAATSHTHAQSDVTNLVSDLAGKAATSHAHAASDITSGTMATARLGSGTASGSTYLRGDQTWATIPGGGGGLDIGPVFDVTDATYANGATEGGAGDTAALRNSKAFQAAINAAVAAGGGLVTIPATGIGSSEGFHFLHPVWINGNNIVIRGQGKLVTRLASRGPTLITNTNPIYWTTSATSVTIGGTPTDVRTTAGSTYLGTWVVDDGRYREDATKFRSGGAVNAPGNNYTISTGYLVGGSEYLGQSFYHRTRGAVGCMARYPYHPAITGNTMPSTSRVTGWESQTQATFEFIVYHHDAVCVGGIAGGGNVSNPDPWHLYARDNGGGSGDYLFCFELTNTKLYERALVWAIVPQVATVDLHRVCFQVDLSGGTPRVSAWVDGLQVNVTMQYPDYKWQGKFEIDGSSFGVEWDRFAMWRGCDFVLGASNELFSVGEVGVTPSDFTIVAATVYTGLRYTHSTAGSAQTRTTTAAYSDNDVCGNQSAVQSGALGCIHSTYARFPLDDPQTAIGLGSYSLNNFVWGYQCPDGTGSHGNSEAVSRCEISGFHVGNPDSIGPRVSASILVGKYLDLDIEDVDLRGAHYASMGVMIGGAVYTLNARHVYLYSTAYLCSCIATLEDVHCGYVNRHAIVGYGAQITIRNGFNLEPGDDAIAWFYSYALTSLSAGFVLSDFTINWESESSPVRVCFVGVEKCTYNNNNKVYARNVVFGATGGVPTFLLLDPVPNFSERYESIIDVDDSNSLPPQSPAVHVQGSDWKGTIHAKRGIAMDEHVQQIRCAASNVNPFCGVKVVIDKTRVRPPTGKYLAGTFELPAKNAPPGAVSRWGVLTSGTDGSDTPAVWNALSYVPKHNENDFAAQVGPSFYTKIAIDWPSSGDPTSLDVASISDYWAEEILRVAMLGVTGTYPRTHFQLIWSLFLPVFSAKTNMNAGYTLLSSAVTANSGAWNAASGRVKTNSGTIAITGTNHGWQSQPFYRKVGFGFNLGDGTTNWAAMVGKTVPMGPDFWACNASTSFNIDAGEFEFGMADRTTGRWSNTTGNMLLDWITNGSMSFPATVYYGLSSTEPAADGTGYTEPSGGSYARVAVTTNSTNYRVCQRNYSAIENAVNITFPAPTADWGECRYVFGSTSSSAGSADVFSAKILDRISPKNGTAAPNMWPGAITFQP